MFRLSTSTLAAALLSGPAVLLCAQTPAPHAAGTVKATTSTGFTLTAASGDLAVTVPATAKVLVVPPGSTNLSAATAGSVTDIATGDRAIVNGTAGDNATALTATRVILMKASAIADVHAAEEAAWAQGYGGIVKAVDPATGAITLSSGMHTIAIATTPTTLYRRYADGSVRFQDAVKSSLAEVRPGNQIRVRGAKSPDGLQMTADEVVTGDFRNYSGLVTAVDASTNSITLKDLTTKKPVTIVLTASSDMHRLPPQIAQGMAARMKASASGQAGSAAHGASAAAPGGEHRPSRDLSSMLARLPAETIGGLKTGEAVMIVATAPSTADGKPMAVTLLAGVDPILTAPSGETMTISPWNMGGSGGDAGGEQ